MVATSTRAPDASPSGAPAGGRPVTRAELVALGAVVLWYLAVTVRTLAIRAPLDHDESVYALRARDLLDGWSHLSGRYWADYRAPGLPLLVTGPFRVFGESPTLARAVVVACGLAILVLTWAIVRRLADPVSAVAAAGVLTVTTGFTTSATTVLADVPGTAFSLAAAYVLLRESQQDRLRWSLVGVPALALAAAVARFGAPLGYIPALVGVSLLALPRWWRARRWDQFARLGITGALTLVVTWLVTSTTLFTQFGQTPWEANSALTGSKGLSPTTGWRDFWDVVVPSADQPSPYWTWPALLLTLVGVVVAVAAAVRHAELRAPVAFTVLVGTAVVVGVVSSVGLVVPNYLVQPAPWVAMAAGIGWGWLGRQVVASGAAQRVPPVAVASAGMAALLLIGLGGWRQTTENAHDLGTFGALQQASIRTGEVLGDGCVIVSSYAPQVGWYSGCDVVHFQNHARGSESYGPEELATALDASVALAVPDGVDVPMGMITVEAGKRQPPDALLDSVRGLYGSTIVELGVPGGRSSHVIARELLPCVPSGTCTVDGGP